jgi:DNA polymerase III delta subunit
MKTFKSLITRSFSFSKKNKEEPNQTANDESQSTKVQNINDEANYTQNDVAPDTETQQPMSPSMTDIQSLAARSIRVTFPKSGSQEDHDKNLQSLLNTLPGIVNVSSFFFFITTKEDKIIN